jgi:hypothetical protein
MTVTEAPTTPVVAANNIDKTIAATPIPPRIDPIHLCRTPNARSATPEVCIMVPINIKRGTAARIYSERVPLNILEGSMFRNEVPEVSNPKTNPTVAIPKANGNPVINIKRLRIISIVVNSGGIIFSFHSYIQSFEKFCDTL